MACIRGGQVGGGRGGWEAKSGLRPSFQDTDSSSVCPVSGTNSHNPQDRPRQLLAIVWHHTSLLMLFTGSTGPVVHLHGLMGSRKALCERRGLLNCCANRNGFYKSSHIYIYKYVATNTHILCTYTYIHRNVRMYVCMDILQICSYVHTQYLHNYICTLYSLWYPFRTTCVCYIYIMHRWYS